MNEVFIVPIKSPNYIYFFTPMFMDIELWNVLNVFVNFFFNFMYILMEQNDHILMENGSPVPRDLYHHIHGYCHAFFSIVLVPLCLV